MSTPQIDDWSYAEISNGLYEIKRNEKISTTNKVIPFLTNLIWKIASELLIAASTRSKGERVELDDIISAYRDLKLDGQWILDETNEDAFYVVLNEEINEDNEGSEPWIAGQVIEDLMMDISEKRLTLEANIFIVFYLEAYVKQTLKRAQARAEEVVRLEDIKKALE